MSSNSLPHTTTGGHASPPNTLQIAALVIESSAKPMSPFPRRLPRDGFPHQPHEGATRLPTTKENVAYLLQQSEVSLAYDVIKKRLSIVRAYDELKLGDLVGLANMNGLYGQWFGEFLTELAADNPHNPVEAFIKARPWDGVDRLQLFFETVTAAADFPDGLKCLLLDRWLKSAVAAGLRSDFHCRGVLTLQGPQGCGKTSWIARLVPPQLQSELVKLDHHLDPHNKDSVFIGISHWITEIGELDSSFRNDIARLKGFLTNTVDKLRLPYARTPIELPRKTVFAASVNERRFLIDPTGNTRFWTIPVERLDYEHTIDMQQLFAQVAEGVEAGAKWWLTPEEEALLEQHNSQFKAVSVIEERLLDALEQDDGIPRYMTPIQVLTAIGFRSPSNQQCRECGRLLRERFGNPKRVHGRDRWKVPLKPVEGTWQPRSESDSVY